jgi:lichenan operon transcriptional antiterminator
MNAKEGRLDELIAALRGNTMTARELGIQLGVSVRSVRDYVRQINRRHGGTLIHSGQSGYSLDAREYHRHRTEAVPPTRDGPERRLYYIVRGLVTNPEGVDVFELGDELYVSPSTIEADLVRARELLRDHRLVVERRRDQIRLVGPERQQRKLVRYLLLNAGQAVLDGSRLGLSSPRQRARTRKLHARASSALGDAGVEVNEYVLNDLLLHLAIAADRVAAGHELAPDDSGRGEPSGPLWRLTQELTAAVAEIYQTTLPRQEQILVYEVLAARSSLAFPEDGEGAVSAQVLSMTREALRELSSQFMIDLYDEDTVTSLAVHVQNLLARARSGDTLSNPLGASFQQMHPLIHEFALLLARQLERRARVRISCGEVDFLAFHIGNQVQRQMEQGPPVTVTLVLPRYYDFPEKTARRLSDALREQAVVKDVVTSISHDWQSITSDLVVSVIDLDDSPSPVIRISPFLTDGDVDRILQAVRAERARTRWDKLRSDVLSLLDPALFVRADPDCKLDALTLLAGRLRDAGYVDDGFLQDVLEREERSSTAFGGVFAIPHSMYQDAGKTGIAVLVSDRGIPWGTSSVRLVLMLAVSPDGRTLFRDVLDNLIDILNNPTNVGRLLAGSADHHQFVRTLATLMR